MSLKHILPREHGSWAVLLAPLLAGAVKAGTIGVNGAMVVVSAIALFLMRVPLERQIRAREKGLPGDPRDLRRIAALGALGMLSGVAVMSRSTLEVFPLGIVAVVLLIVQTIMEVRHPRSLGSGLVGVVGMSAGAPAMWAAETGRIGATGLLLWLLTALFFAASFAYVHMKIAAVSMRNDEIPFTVRIGLGSLSIAYHAVAIFVVIGLTASGWTSFRLILVFVPMTIHAIWGTLRLATHVQFAKLGILLTAHALFFAVALGILL